MNPSTRPHKFVGIDRSLDHRKVDLLNQEDAQPFDDFLSIFGGERLPDLSRDHREAYTRTRLLQRNTEDFEPLPLRGLR